MDVSTQYSGHGTGWNNYFKQSRLLYCLQGSRISMDVKKYCLGQGSGRGKLIFQSNGFTLIELLVTFTVASILVASAFPSFSALIAQERSTVLTNTLAGALAYARSESVTKQTTTLTCQSNNGSECSRSGNWHNGWIIFIDTNNNKQRESEETLLRVYTTANNGTQAIFNGAANIDHYIRYKPSGQAYPNGSFLICNPAIGVGKALIMTQSGRLRLSKRQRTGSAITC